MFVVLSAVSDAPTHQLFRADLCKRWDSVIVFVEILKISDGLHAKCACVFIVFGRATISKARVSRQHCEILTIAQQGTLHLECGVKFTDCAQRIPSMSKNKMLLKANLSFR